MKMMPFLKSFLGFLGGILLFGFFSSLGLAEKMSLPVSVEISLKGAVQPETDTPVMITITPWVLLRELETTVRGIDGIEVKMNSDPIQKKHGGVPAGTSVLHAVFVSISPGTAGYLVVDVSYEEENGVRQGTSKTFLIGTEGAVPELKQSGTVSVDSEGQAIIINQSLVKK